MSLFHCWCCGGYFDYDKGWLKETRNNHYLNECKDYSPCFKCETLKRRGIDFENKKHEKKEVYVFECALNCKHCFKIKYKRECEFFTKQENRLFRNKI